MAKLCICWWLLCGPLICDMVSRFGLILAPSWPQTYCQHIVIVAVRMPMPRHVIHSFATVMPSKIQFIWLGGFRHWHGFSGQTERYGDTERYKTAFAWHGIRTHRKSFSATWLIRRVLIPDTHCIIIIIIGIILGWIFWSRGQSSGKGCLI